MSICNFLQGNQMSTTPSTRARQFVPTWCRQHRSEVAHQYEAPSSTPDQSMREALQARIAFTEGPVQ